MHQVHNTVTKLEERGLLAIIIVITETKLEPGVEISLPGYYCSSRRDRDRHGGGVAVFVDDAYVAFESYRADANGDVAWPGVAPVDSDDEEFGQFLRSRAEIEADAMQWDAAAAAEAAAERAGADVATGADDGRDADVDEDRPPHADGGGRASDGEDSEAETVEEQPDSTAAQRAWNADVRRRGVALVKAREATLFAKKKPPNDADFKVKSAALWREIAEPDPTGAQFSRLRYWMRTCVFGLTADATGAALVATLCGCWWAAPTGCLLTPEGDIVPSVCGACGAESYGS